MRFTALAISTVAMVSSIASAQSVTRYAQLRLYTKPDCLESNLGELGVYDTDINQCKAFKDDEVVGSVLFEYNPFGCDLHIYTDAECGCGDHDVALNQCLTGDDRYLSYKLDCAV